MLIRCKRSFKPLFELGFILGFKEVLTARLLLLTFKKDSLHDLVKQIPIHKKFAIFSFDSRNFNAEVQNVSNIFAARGQITNFFAFFYGFGDLSLKF